MSSTHSPLDIKSLAQSLNTKIIGERLHYFEEIDSTNNKAIQLAEDKAPEGTIVIADFQKQGRGRENRKWIAPANRNLLFSFILRPPAFVHTAPQMTTIAAVAVCETIRKETKLPAMIKWPNDIRIYAKKVSGILTEMKARKNKIEYIVVGIGINLNMEKEEFPLELQSISTSLSIESKKTIEREIFLKTIITSLDSYYNLAIHDGLESIIRQWKELSDMPGKLVKIISPTGILEGYITNIDTDGGLLIRQKDGFIQKILTGEIQILE